MSGTFIWLPPAGGGGGGSAFYGDPVADYASLPVPGGSYEVRFVEDVESFYYYDPVGGIWEPVKIAYLIDINDDTTGTLDVDRGGTGSSTPLVGDFLMQSATGGSSIVESIVTPTDVVNLQSDVTQLQSDVTDLQADVTQAQSDIVDLQTDKMDKVVSTDDVVVRFDGATGDVKDGVTTISDTGEVKAVLSMGLTPITTIQRDALTASNGMIIYNSDTDRFEGYFAGAWALLHGWGF